MTSDGISVILYKLARESPKRERTGESGSNLENDTEKRNAQEERKPRRGPEANRKESLEGPEVAEDSEDSEEFNDE